MSADVAVTESWCVSRRDGRSGLIRPTSAGMGPRFLHPGRQTHRGRRCRRRSPSAGWSESAASVTVFTQHRAVVTEYHCGRHAPNAGHVAAPGLSIQRSPGRRRRADLLGHPGTSDGGTPRRRHHLGNCPRRSAGDQHLGRCGVTIRRLGRSAWSPTRRRRSRFPQLLLHHAFDTAAQARCAVECMKLMSARPAAASRCAAAASRYSTSAPNWGAQPHRQTGGQRSTCHPRRPRTIRPTTVRRDANASVPAGSASGLLGHSIDRRYCHWQGTVFDLARDFIHPCPGGDVNYRRIVAHPGTHH